MSRCSIAFSAHFAASSVSPHLDWKIISPNGAPLFSPEPSVSSRVSARVLFPVRTSSPAINPIRCGAIGINEYAFSAGARASSNLPRAARPILSHAEAAAKFSSSSRICDSSADASASRPAASRQNASSTRLSRRSGSSSSARRYCLIASPTENETTYVRRAGPKP